MKVLVVGGGSGGHITPAVAVVRELLKIRPRAKVEFWTDRKYYKNVVKITTEIGVRWGEEVRTGSRQRPYIRVRKVAAGKFHRYAGWTWRDYFENWEITLKDLIWGNICGFCGFMGGLAQSLVRLIRKSERPDVIFLKGGFVGLPVGLVARLLSIPYVIHESDAVPGLANRLLMKRARVVALGTALAFREPRPSRPSSRGSGAYPRQQPADVPETQAQSPSPASHARFIYTGTPVAPEFRRVTAARQKSLKKAAGFDPERPLVVVTGGSQGSENINLAMREILPEMLKFASVGLVAGRKHYEEMVDLKKYEEWGGAELKSNFRMWNFSPVMHELMGAADVVVSRAGATTIAELAALEKAVVLVPFERLPGGHQVKNAEQLVEAEAVMMVKDAEMQEQPGMLLTAVRKLIRSPKLRETMAKKLGETAQGDAAKRLAEIVINVGEGK